MGTANDDVIILSPETLVGLNADEHVEIARRGSKVTGLSLSLQPEPGARIDTSRNPSESFLVMRTRPTPRTSYTGL